MRVTISSWVRNLMIAFRPYGIAAVCVLCFIAQAKAQSGTSSTDGSTPLGLAPGAPGGSYALSGFDNINPYSGSLNFRLPLVHVGGRGGAQHTVTLPIETHWRTIKSGIHAPFAYYPTEGGWLSLSAGYGAGVMVARLTGVNDSMTCEAVTNALTRLTFTGPDGTEYEFHDVLYNGAVRNNFFAGTGGVDCHLDVNQSGFGTTDRGRVFVTADGSSATFVSDTDIYDFCVDCPPADYGGIGITELRPTGNLMMRDGTLYRIVQGEVTYIRDRNGNLITFTFGAYGVTKITDSLNREVNINYVKDGQGNPLRDEITYRGFGANVRTVTVNYGSLINALRLGFTIKKLGGASGLFPELNGSSSTDFNPLVVKSVTLPNNKSYQFYYDSYAELARVILPSAGAFEYDYDSGLVGGSASGVVTTCATKEIYRRVVQKRTYVDGQGLTGGGILEGKMNLGRPEDSGGGNAGRVDIDSLDANNAVFAHSSHYYSGSTVASWCRQPTDYSRWKDDKEFKTRIYDRDGVTELQRIVQNWQQPVSGSNWPLTQAETSDDARPNDPQTIDTTTTLYATVAGESNQVAYQTFAYDRYVNKSDTYEYDFGPGALIRRTHTDYLTTNNGANYATDTTIHIRSLPLLQWVSSDAAGNSKKAQSSFEYDNYNQITSDTFHASMTSRSSITGLDTNYTTTHYARGNVTRTTRSLIDTGGTINGYAQYDVAGNVVKAVDPRSTTSNIIATTFDFTDAYGYPDSNAEGNELPLPTELPSSVHTYAFATKATNALNQNAFTQYDYYLGKPVNGKDANGIVAKGTYDDALDRPRAVDTGIFSGSQLQHHTSFAYDDTARTITTHSDQVTLNDGVLTSTILYDGLGRTTETQQPEPGGTIIHNVQQYDGMGRVKRSYNPYRAPTGESTNGYADTNYDGLGRVRTVTTSDGAVVSTSYSANATTVTDQASKQRRSITDGLGRLIRVDEPNTAGSLGTVAAPNQPTTYGYDVLDDLTGVTQGSQTRSFSYDSLKRLKQAINPESGTINYTYDANSNLLTKQDARSITTTYFYDALNRATKRTYSDSTPEVDYYYDNQTLPTSKPPNFTPAYSNGRLIAVCYAGTTSSAGSYQSYDQLGRVNLSYQQTDSINYGFAYGYNLASEMTSETYPSGRQVITEYDTAGRAAGIRAAAIYYAGATASDATNRIQYAPQGAVSVMKLGNGKWEHTNFNNRLQPAQIGLGTSGTDSSVMKLDYAYNTTGQTNNNGNVVTQTITIGSTVMNQSYGYDALNRLSSATETGAWTQTYDCDRYGNRAVRVSSFIPTPALTPQSGSSTDFSAFNQGNNRIQLTGFGYDASGNLKNDPTTPANAMVYDAENRQVSYTKNGTTAYSYDGDGHRVKKVADSLTTVFVYNAMGQLTAEYTNDTVPPVGGGGTSYLTSDHLGSTRVVTKSDGTVKARYDYLPFGEDLGAGVGQRTTGMGYSAADSTKQKFTQKERDNESGLDYFLARYYSSAQGRFTSVDPHDPILNRQLTNDPDEATKEFLKYLGQPQNWDRYPYVWNSPLRFVDPTGEKVYVVAYTTGNSKGDDELRRAAETYADELQQSSGFDPKNDTVLVVGVKSHDDFQKALDSIATPLIEKTYGKVEQVALFSHSGFDGPVFHRNTTGAAYQMTASDLSRLKVNWSPSGSCNAIGCRTAVTFAQMFADAQGVPTYGYKEYAYFSASNTKMDPNIKAGGPVYLIAADYGEANGAISHLRYMMGNGRVYSLIRRDPTPKTAPTLRR